MPKDIHQRDTAQQRSSRLLLAMGIIVLLGALAYFVLTLVVNRRTPASPDTRYTAENGISVYYESAVWPVCEMTEDATLGRALKLLPPRAATTPTIRSCSSRKARKTPMRTSSASRKKSSSRLTASSAPEGQPEHRRRRRHRRAL